MLAVDPDRERRPLGARSATMLVVASTIGTGVFTTSGLLLADLGSARAVMFAWALGGALAICGALAYGELTAALPENGGEYALLSRIYHPAVGFVSGWLSLIVGFSAPMAAAAIAFGAYLEPWVPGVDARLWAVLLIIAFSSVHARAVRGGVRVQDAITTLQIATVALVAVFGLALGDPPAALARGEGPSVASLALGGELAVGLVWVSFSYTGWNAAAYVAGEVREPGRALPRALLGGTTLVAVLYLALNAAFLASAPPDVLAGRVDVAQVAARHLLGERAARGVGAVVALGLATTVGAIAMTGPRVYERMGQDHPRLAILTASRRGRGPVRAILLQTLLALVLAATATFEALLTYIGFTLALSTALTLAGVFVLRAREPELARPYRAWGHPFTTGLAIALSVWMVAHTLAQRPLAALVGVATIALGLLLYAITSVRAPTSRRTRPEDRDRRAELV